MIPFTGGDKRWFKLLTLVAATLSIGAQQAQAQMGTSTGISNSNSYPNQNTSYNQPAVRAASDNTAGSNSKGAVLNTALGSALIARGTMLLHSRKTRPRGRALIAMGMLAMAQAGNQADTSVGSLDISDLVDDGGLTTGGGGGSSTTPDGIPTQEYLERAGMSPSDARDALARYNDAKAKGFSLNAEKGEVKFPDGTVAKSDNFASPSALASSGIPIEDANAVFDTASKEAEKVEKENRMIATLEEGGAAGGGMGGGAGGVSYETGYDPAETSLGSASIAGTSETQPKRSVAGMSTNFNGDPIGVSADNIFKMMTRRYQLKQKQNFFLGEHEANRTK